MVYYTQQKMKKAVEGRTSAAFVFEGENFMPKNFKRPCKFGGCPRLTEKKSGYCEEHEKIAQKNYEKFSRGYKGSERYGGRWKKIRDNYIKKNPLCEKCFSEGKLTLGKLVHHKKSISEGGTNEEKNLMTLCVSCHEKIHRRRGG